MVINKKSQVLFYTLMLATVIIVFTLAIAKPTKEFITTARSDMNCSDSTISDYDKATCYGLDIILWFFLCLLIVIAFVVLGAKIVGG